MGASPLRDHHQRRSPTAKTATLAYLSVFVPSAAIELSLYISDYWISFRNSTDSRLIA